MPDALHTTLARAFVDWECPVCGAVQADPAEVERTTCAAGHVVTLRFDAAAGRFEVAADTGSATPGDTP